MSHNVHQQYKMKMDFLFLSAETGEGASVCSSIALVSDGPQLSNEQINKH